MPERNTMKKIQELQQVKGDAYDYYIAGNEDTDLFEKIFLVDDIVEKICLGDIDIKLSMRYIGYDKC